MALQGKRNELYRQYLSLSTGSTFLYYCGRDKPNLALVIDIDRDQTIFFGTDPDINDIIWTGPVPSLEALAAKAGINNCQPYNKLSGYFSNYPDLSSIHFIPPYRLEHTLSLQQLLDSPKGKVPKSVSNNLIKAIINQRIVKSNEKIAQIEEAVSISA